VIDIDRLLGLMNRATSGLWAENTVFVAEVRTALPVLAAELRAARVVAVEAAQLIDICRDAPGAISAGVRAVEKALAQYDRARAEGK
jgi:hypothetical protein